MMLTELIRNYLAGNVLDTVRYTFVASDGKTLYEVGNRNQHEKLLAQLEKIKPPGADWSMFRVARVKYSDETASVRHTLVNVTLVNAIILKKRIHTPATFYPFNIHVTPLSQRHDRIIFGLMFPGIIRRIRPINAQMMCPRGSPTEQ